LGALTDISELRTLQEQYRHAQRMEAIGRLAGGVAHDFNNLLTVISGQADLVRHRLPPNDPNLRAMEAIQSAAMRAGAITQQLLAFSRKQKLQPRRIDLAAQVRGLCQTLSRSLGSGVRVETSLPLGEVPVEADPGQLDQVLLNLLVNARDAMPDGGRVAVTLRRDPPWALLEVRDEGTGIAPEVLPRIFEPFFTTKGQGKGTGLGLATVYGVVKQSGGDIKVSSQVGKGTSFVVQLPLLAEAARPAEASVAGTTAAAGRRRVLLVDDDDEIRNLLEHALQARDYDVQTAPNGAAALQKLTEQGGAADLLVTDLIMPELDGAALAQRVGETWPGMRILMITGYADDEVASAETLGRYRLLRKPFSLPQFLEQVNSALQPAEHTA
ncbi:MAG: response regulator, partial [Planctomycetes bacterium]|nr:response regulator [Planctomycetota bacterium]